MFLLGEMFLPISGQCFLKCQFWVSGASWNPDWTWFDITQKGLGEPASQKEIMASIAVFLFATLFLPLLSQTKFGDSQKTKDVDKKIFTGDPTIDTLGGGLIGVGLGALGASVLGPTIGQVMMTNVTMTYNGAIVFCS